MKNILVLMHDDSGQEARLQAALDVTRAVEGHLVCVDVAVMPQVIGDFYSGAGEAMLLADERVREADNRAAIEARLAHEQVSWNWVETTGTIAPCVAEQAALADLIVINRQLDDFPVPDMRSAAGELIRAHRPVLAVPPGSRGIDLSGKALVCWDGSAASVEALRAATPLLRLAQSVVLFVVEDGSEQRPAEEAAAYLSRHGVHASVRRQPAFAVRPEIVILEELGRQHTAYAVMGGFGHSRFVEALLGGVTRTMLTESPVPVLFAR